MPPASVLLSCHVYEGDQGRRTSSPSSAERWPSEVGLHWVMWRRRPQLSWVSFLMLWHRGLWPLLSSSHFFGNNLALGRRTPLPPLIRLMLPAHACPCFLPFSTYCHWTQGQLACPLAPHSPFLAPSLQGPSGYKGGPRGREWGAGGSVEPSGCSILRASPTFSPYLCTNRGRPGAGCCRDTTCPGSPVAGGHCGGV